MINITVRPDGGEPFEVVATSRDIVNWERTTKGASITKLQQAATYTDVYRIAHFAVQRTGRWAGSLDEFMSTCDIEFEQENDEPDPTNAAH